MDYLAWRIHYTHGELEEQGSCAGLLDGELGVWEGYQSVLNGCYWDFFLFVSVQYCVCV